MTDWNLNWNKSSGNKWDINWTKGKTLEEKVVEEKKERISQGLPVSVKKTQATPTLSGDIIRGAIKPFADVASNLLGGANLSNNYLGKVEGLGKIDITKSPFEKENLKTIIKSASTGAEIASYLNAAGVAKNTIANLTKQGVLASKKTFAEWAVKMMPELAKEGFGQGIAYTVGSQGREYADTGKPFSGKQAITDVATSTLGNVILPMGLQKVFGKSTSKILGARAAERALSDAEILGRKIPDAGVPSAKYMTESGRTLPAPRKPGEIPIELPSTEIAAAQRRLNEVSKVETPEIPKSPAIKEAEQFNSRQDYINYKTENQSNYKGLVKDKKVSTIPGQILQTSRKQTPEQLAKIWDEAHTTPKQQPLAPLPKQEVPTQSTQSKVEQPNINQEAPKQNIDDVINEIDNKAQEAINNDPLKVDSINLLAEGEKARAAINTLGKERARRIALGIDSAPEGVKAEAIHSELTNIAQKENDYILGKELATSDLFKPSAQAINLAKLKEPNSFYWAIKDISDSLKKKQSIVTKMNEKSAINNIAQKIRKSIESVNLDNFSIKKLAASLICK